MVVSGAPDRTRYHAIHICDMALDMVEAMSGLRDPSSKGNMKIRVGQFSILLYYMYTSLLFIKSYAFKTIVDFFPAYALRLHKAFVIEL